MRCISFTAALLVLTVPSFSTAQSVCVGPTQAVAPLPPPPVREGVPVDVEADFGFNQGSQAVLEGRVKLTRADQELLADQLVYDQLTGRGRAEGGVRYTDYATTFTAQSMAYDLTENRSELDALRYQLRNSSGRGEADHAEMVGEQLALDNVVFTTCPDGDNGWALVADEMTLDRASGRGLARGAKLKFKNLPLLYLPAASFPIDDRRQSGFLYPTLGSSNDNGLDLSVPYYWNIAPNQDATLTPRLISDRGLMLEGQYRYLNQRWGRGQIDWQYLPDDDLTNRDRGYARFSHRGQVTDHWATAIEINDVSDVRFFEDFGESLAGASPSYLRSRLELFRRGSWWRAGILFDDYEIVDPAVTANLEPYARLPRATFVGRRDLNNNLHLETEFEAAWFDRDEGLEGSRLDWSAFISRPWYQPGYYVIPRFGLRHTAYDLKRDVNDNPTRTLPIASVEAGLAFERALSSGRRQTLEPRFQLLYVPFEDQSELPEFDTRELTFSYGQLFRTNRFTGADRQADARQLSLGLTTRVFDAAGRSPFEATLGTIVYFDELQVQRSDQAAVDIDSSPVVAELRYRPSQRWSLGTTLQWDPEDERTEQAVFDARFRSDEGRLLNFSYRQRRNLLEQLDASALWPVNERWKVLGRWNYSLREDTTLEALAGVEYSSCCWAIRLFGRQYLRNDQGDKRTGLLLELELKGLGSLGRGSQRLLERAILGYGQPPTE